MTISLLIFFYVALMLGTLVALDVETEMRRRRFGPGRTEDKIFRCTTCGNVYTDDPDVDRSRCAQCGKLNEPIQF